MPVDSSSDAAFLMVSGKSFSNYNYFFYEVSFSKWTFVAMWKLFCNEDKHHKKA